MRLTVKAAVVMVAVVADKGAMIMVVVVAD